MCRKAPNCKYKTMLFRYKKRNYALFIDWLSFSVTMLRPDDELNCPKGYRLENYDGNNIFKKRAILFDNQGTKLITMLWQPHSTLLSKNLMTVQFSNEVLYFERERECITLLSQVCEHMFNSFSRLDVCLDFQVNDTQSAIIRKLFNGSMYVQGKAEGSIFWHESEYKGIKSRAPHCLSWGSPTSKIRCKLYNKSREQNLLSEGKDPEKPYIVDIWKSAGFDILRMWRLEFSLNSTGQMQWAGKNITWDEYFDCNWWYMLFLSLYTNRFIVRKNEGKREGHKNNDRIVSFIELPTMSKELKWKKSEEPESRPEVVSAIRRAMRELESPICQSSVYIFDAQSAALRRLVEHTGMGAWFLVRYGKSVYQYCDEMGQNVGAGSFKVGLKPSMSWD